MSKVLYNVQDKLVEFSILCATQFMTEASKTLRKHLWIFNPYMNSPLDLAGGVWEKHLLCCSDFQSHQAAYRPNKNSICCSLWKLIIKYYTAVGRYEMGHYNN